ncbi:MAG: hypothetical protein EAX86_05000 [Candidatus Heimdallarchaeota archaeon]|nr:hypothetical protein [Candidatus Heimdallarchaeota archaeon]
MIDNIALDRIITTLLGRIEAQHQEIGRLLIHDEFQELESTVNLWAVREGVRDLKETRVTDLSESDEYEIKLTFAPPSFFTDVLEGRKSVPYWQIATVIRLLRNSDIIYDPRGRLKEWVQLAPQIKWQSEVIELKRQTTQVLLSRMNNRIQEDMLADAYIWLIKAAEEAICIPLMEKNDFDIGPASLLLDSLNQLDIKLFQFFANLIQIPSFNYEKLINARKELELLAEHLYRKNVKTEREMWILTAFVSINESEKRLNQYSKALKAQADDKIIKRLYQTAVGELWQAFFLVAQNPRLDVKLDPPVVGSFWKWFGSPNVDEKWIKEQEEKVKIIAGI